MPPEDAIFYSEESNVIDTLGKSTIIASEIEHTHTFIGGTEQEYVKYLSSDKAQPLWEWELASKIKTYAGMSAVPKKDGILQRKLLMLCSSNYWFSDVKRRADLGMCGGASLSRGHATDGNYYMASCDEDSAFTHIERQDWMWTWNAAPPLSI